MRPHPEDGMESGLLVAVDCLVARGEVLVFEQLSAVWLGQWCNGSVQRNTYSDMKNEVIVDFSFMGKSPLQRRLIC